MEITCPSCSRPHKLSDHPGAFDIPCECGYSILVPDLQQTNPSQKAETVAGSAVAPLSAPLPIAAEMTPPEALPSEMPYDPFELPDPQKHSGISNDTSSRTGKTTQRSAAAEHLEAESLSLQGAWAGLRFDLSWEGLSPETTALWLRDLDLFFEPRAWLVRLLHLEGLTLKDLSRKTEIKNVPEVLAIEMYLRIVERGGICKFSRAKTDETTLP